jgi:hypothetical protein
MIVGLGLGHRARLARENFRFARQAGATHIVATLLNSSPANAPGTEEPFLVSRSRPDLWSREALTELRRQVESEDLHLEEKNMTDSPRSTVPSALPEVITSYLTAHMARDIEAAIGSYALDATVTDEGTTYRGPEEIRRRLSRSGASSRTRSR